MTATLTLPAKDGSAWRERWADIWLAEQPLRAVRESARTSAGAPVSDPAVLENHPEPGRVGDRSTLRSAATEDGRSKMPMRSGAASRCAIPDPTEPRRLDDATWIAQVCHGNETAARDLVERLYPTVMKIVRCRLPRRTQEEDLAQAVFARVFRSLHQFSGRVPLEHWVARIAINTCINQLKYESGRPELRMSDLSEEQEAVVQQLAFTNDDLPPERGRAAHELLQQLLAPLRPDDRLVIRLLHLEERKVAEIVQMTGWSASRVKVKAFRARHRMRRLWKSLIKTGDW